MLQRWDSENKLRKYRRILSKMHNTITKQKNLSIDVKNGLKELKEVINANTFNRTLPNYAEEISKCTSRAGTTNPMISSSIRLEEDGKKKGTVTSRTMTTTGN